MVKPSVFLDIVPEGKRTGEVLSARNSWLTGTVVAVREAGSIEVRLDGATEAEGTVVAPCQVGTYAVGAKVRCLADSSGRITLVEPPVELPSDVPVQDRVVVGDAPRETQDLLHATGRWMFSAEDRLNAMSGQIADAVEETKTEVADARAELSARLQSAEVSVQSAVSQAESASQTANNAVGQLTVSERPPTFEDGDGKPANAVWHHIVDGVLLGQYVWNPLLGVWRSTPVDGATFIKTGTIHGNQIVAGSVTAREVTASESLWAKLASFVKVTTGMLVAGGARIGGDLLAETIRLSTRLIAGNPDGNHTLLDGLGMRVFRKPAGDADPIEVIKLGVDGAEDYLGVANSEGVLVAGINGEGGASFSEATIKGTVSAGDLRVNGRTLGQILEEYATREIVLHAMGQDYNPGGNHSYPANTSVPIVRLSYQNTTRFTKRIVVPSASIMVETTGGDTWVWGAWKYSSSNNGSDPGVPTGLKTRTSGLAHSGQVLQHTSSEVEWSVPPGGWIRLHYELWAGAPFRVQYNSIFQWRVREESVRESASGVMRLEKITPNVVSAPVTTRATHVKEYAPTWWQNYHYSSGAQFSGWNGMDKAGQGTYGSRTLKSMIGFPSMVDDLSGAGIEKIEVYVYMAHWWYGSGGTVGIGFHGATSAPASAPSGQPAVNARTSKPGGAWVTVQSNLYGAFQSGFLRGIMLIPNKPGDPGDYGYATASATRIRVTYTK